MTKPILDVTAGSRMFWRNKQNPNIAYSDFCIECKYW